MRHVIFSDTSCPLLNISNIGYTKNPDFAHFGVGVRNSYIIHYVLSGVGYFNGNRVHGGQGFLITPGMQEHYYPDEQSPWDFLWIVSDDPAMHNLFPLFHADKRTNIFQYDYSDSVREAADFLIANGNSRFGAYEILEFFLKIFKHQQKEAFPSPDKPCNQIYVEATVKYINSNIHRPITVHELTEVLGISQPYLFKIFKESLAQAPKQYILEQKLVRAKILLKETKLSVTHIANSVGFSDVLSFSKCFRLKVGVSPQAYRSQMLSEQSLESI